MGNNKRKNDSDNQSSKKQDTNACPKFSTPKQSMSNAHTQLKAISEHLCRNGHPAQGQSLDLNKIEPINLLPLITDYVKPQEYDAIVNVIPNSNSKSRETKRQRKGYTKERCRWKRRWKAEDPTT